MSAAAKLLGAAEENRISDVIGFILTERQRRIIVQTSLETKKVQAQFMTRSYTAMSMSQFSEMIKARHGSVDRWLLQTEWRFYSGNLLAMDVRILIWDIAMDDSLYRWFTSLGFETMRMDTMEDLERIYSRIKAIQIYSQNELAICDSATDQKEYTFHNILATTILGLIDNGRKFRMWDHSKGEYSALKVGVNTKTVNNASRARMLSFYKQHGIKTTFVSPSEPRDDTSTYVMVPGDNTVIAKLVGPGLMMSVSTYSEYAFSDPNVAWSIALSWLEPTEMIVFKEPTEHSEVEGVTYIYKPKPGCFMKGGFSMNPWVKYCRREESTTNNGWLQWVAYTYTTVVPPFIPLLHDFMGHYVRIWSSTQVRATGVSSKGTYWARNTVMIEHFTAGVSSDESMSGTLLGLKDRWIFEGDLESDPEAKGLFTIIVGNGKQATMSTEEFVKKARPTYIQISGHLSHLLILSAYMPIDIVRYLKIIEANILVTMRESSVMKIVGKHNGTDLVHEKQPITQLWHNYVEYELAVRAARYFSGVMSIPINEDLLRYVSRQLKRLRNLYPIFSEASFAAKQLAREKRILIPSLRLVSD